MRNKDLKDKVYKGVYQNSSLGYVLTPSELAFEMVSTLPSEVFQSDSTKFLDPITKSGTFLFEIAEKLYDQGHSIKNIQSRIYTVDSNTHSLNIANSYIKYILNRESGGFKVDLKSTEKYFNYLINRISNGKYTTFSHFIDIILLDKNDNYLMAEFQKTVNEFIKEYERVSKLESKLFGEVFTQRRLIDEMLDALPKEVWNDHKLKWLDPAVGIGNFPAAIKDRYMESLVNIFPDDKERERYILEEMLYMCDISIKNLFILYNIFDKNNEFKLNVYRGSFLEEGFDKHMKEVWGLDGFDVIVGNPPYQDINNNGATKHGSGKLYPEFINKSVHILNEFGLLCFINPNTWFSGSEDSSTGKILHLFKKYNLIKLDSESEKISLQKRYFEKVGTGELTYFVLEKKENYKNTLINNEFYLNIKKYDFLPNFLSKNTISILEKTLLNKELEKIKIVKDSGEYHRSKTTRNDNKEISSVSKNGYFKIVNSITKKEGIKFLYMPYKNYFQNSIKILISQSSSFENMIIDNGEYGFTQNVTAIICDSIEEAEYIKSFLNTKIYKYIINITKYGPAISPRMLGKLPYLPIGENPYNYFNLTQEEIDLIENTIKD